MAQRIDLTGTKYGRLTAVTYAGKAKWNCLCDCGVSKDILTSSLRGGLTTSCGCYRKEATKKNRTTHGNAQAGNRTRTYRIWCNIKTRTTNPKATGFSNYGGRGITVCDRWAESFEEFLSDMGECPEGLSIDREDNNGNYEPSNCRWATAIEQANNQRLRIDAVLHEGKSAKEWALELDTTKDAIYGRLRNHGNTYGGTSHDLD